MLGAQEEAVGWDSSGTEARGNRDVGLRRRQEGYEASCST